MFMLVSVEPLKETQLLKNCLDESKLLSFVFCLKKPGPGFLKKILTDYWQKTEKVVKRRPANEKGKFHVKRYYLAPGMKFPSVKKCQKTTQKWVSNSNCCSTTLFLDLSIFPTRIDPNSSYFVLRPSTYRT